MTNNQSFIIHLEDDLHILYVGTLAYLMMKRDYLFAPDTLPREVSTLKLTIVLFIGNTEIIHFTIMPLKKSHHTTIISRLEKAITSLKNFIIFFRYKYPHLMKYNEAELVIILC